MSDKSFEYKGRTIDFATFNAMTLQEKHTMIDELMNNSNVPDRLEEGLAFEKNRYSSNHETSDCVSTP
jgi:hypothetical protein